MDWHKLQHTLFNLDPTDPREDLAKIKSQLQAGSANLELKKDYLSESVEVPQGSLSLDKNYTVEDFAALAGVKLTETKKQKDGDYAQRKTIPSAKAGRTKHPDDGKLVGESPLDSVRAGIKSAQSGVWAPDSAERYSKSALNVKDKPPSVQEPSPTTSAKGQITDKVYSNFLKQHTTALKTIAHDPLKKKKFDRFMATMGETIEEKKNTEPPKQRNPVAAYAQTSGAGVHKDQNKKKQSPRKEKYKNKFPMESIKEELYRRLNKK